MLSLWERVNCCSNTVIELLPLSPKVQHRRIIFTMLEVLGCRVALTVNLMVTLVHLKVNVQR